MLSPGFFPGGAGDGEGLPLALPFRGRPPGNPVSLRCASGNPQSSIDVVFAKQLEMMPDDLPIQDLGEQVPTQNPECAQKIVIPTVYAVFILAMVFLILQLIFNLII